MKAQHYIQFSKILILSLLALGVGWGWPVQPVLADEPDQPSTEVVVTAEPVTPTPTAEPDESGVIIDPPTTDELGEPVKSENYVPQDDAQDKPGGAIDIFDLTFVAGRYGSTDSAADLNLDGVVDIFDLTILASHYGQSEPEVGAAALPQPAPLPIVEANSKFGSFDLSVEAEQPEASVQSYYGSRPLRIGVSVNYVKIYDYMDGQTNSPPDPYAQVAVGGVSASTSIIYNRYEAWPYWRLGWWRYANFPWAPKDAFEANSYTLPINLEIRDDDGYICYGYYGCRSQFEYVDISSRLYQRAKNLTFYPASCKVVDEAGEWAYGTWLDSNRCRIYLQSWGTEWARGYVSYYVDALWE